MSRGVAWRILAAAVVLGLLLGAGWALLAPAVPAAVGGDGRVVVVDAQSADGFDPVGLFLASTFGAGLLGGTALWRWRSRRGPRLLVTSVLAGGVCALVAGAAGLLLASLRYDGAVEAAGPGSLVEAAPSIGSWSVVLAAPLGVSLAQTVLVALGRRDDLGRPDPEPCTRGASGPPD